MASNRITYQDWIVEIGRDPSRPPAPEQPDEIPDRTAREEPGQTDPRLDSIRSQVQKAMNALTESEQGFLIDFYFLGESYESMAARQGRAVYKLEALHQRALRKLRKSLAGLASREYGIRVEKHPRCPVCSSPHRAEIDRVIRSRKEHENWGTIMRRVRDRFGVEIRSPQTIIGHLKYHENV